MSMPGVAMIVRMAGMAVTVIMAMVVGMPGHAPILTAKSRGGNPARLLGTLTPQLPEWIDGLANHCHDEYKLITCACWRRTGLLLGILRLRI